MATFEISSTVNAGLAILPLEQLLDMPNMGMDIGERIQDIRDRRIIGLSAIAGFLEDRKKPDYPAWVRARWSRLSEFDALEGDFWHPIDPSAGVGRLPKNKTEAVILATPHSAVEELENDLKQQVFTGGIAPAAAFRYRGVSRVGILPQNFGTVDNEAAVAMQIGRNQFDVSMALAWIPSEGFAEQRIRRKEIMAGMAFVLPGVHIVGRLPSEKVPLAVPLV